MTKAERDLAIAWAHTDNEILVLDPDSLTDDLDTSPMSDEEFNRLMAELD